MNTKNCALSVVAMLLATATSLQAAVSTWLGTNATAGTAWTNPPNWFPASVPNVGDDVVIADTTGNNLNLADGRTIGALTFGTTGTRTSAFTIGSNAPNASLTINNGLVANGNIGAVLNFLRLPTVIGAGPNLVHRRHARRRYLGLWYRRDNPWHSNQVQFALCEPDKNQYGPTHVHRRKYHRQWKPHDQSRRGEI
ncbi:MAG: hypothetical protein U1F83_15120 [Verrucomicrobiota bacterium]